MRMHSPLAGYDVARAGSVLGDSEPALHTAFLLPAALEARVNRGQSLRITKSSSVPASRASTVATTTPLPRRPPVV